MIERSAFGELALFAKAKIFRGVGEIPGSVGWLAKDGYNYEFRKRELDFGSINDYLESEMSYKEPIPDELREVRKLQGLLEGTPIPSLERVRSDFYNLPAVRTHIEGLFAKIREDFPAWARVNPDFPSQGTPAMGALIEGFGRYLGIVVTKSETRTNIINAIGRAYTMAFEEILITRFESSPILDDVIGWMVEERESFPQGIQTLIDQKAGELKSVPINE